MSSDARKSPRIEDLISTEDDTLGSSISLSIGENSVRIKEKPKIIKEAEQLSTDKKNTPDKWWLKRPETRLGVLNTKNVDAKSKQSPIPLSDVSSSMKEFLEKERMCKTTSKSEGEAKDKDDTLCDILASAAFDKYPSDFENATDEDIGSFLEEMSKIAGALSPNSCPERTKSGGSNKNPTEEEKSVEELLEEAEKLVRKNCNTLSKSISKSDTLVPENEDESLSRVRQLEADIFQLIEEEVHKETEKIKRSPRNERKRENSPGFEIVYENLNNLKPPKTLELQRKKFEEQKVEISSSSDLDDPIERHSKSEELKSAKKIEMEKENLQKEITDVDKDFFEDLLRRSKEKAEGGMSASSSFGQEDFSHFLKLLQGQNTDKTELESKEPNAMYDLFLKSTNGEVILTKESQLASGKTPEFPEREFSEILEKELPAINSAHMDHEINESDSSMSEGQHKGSQNSQSSGKTLKQSKNESKKTASKVMERESNKNITETNKKAVNSESELYTVGLTPRLELFADAIPKLMAEKLSESIVKENTEKADSAYKESTCSETKVDTKAENSYTVNVSKTSKMHYQEVPDHGVSSKAIDIPKTDRIVSAPSNKQSKKEIRFCKSKSYDLLCQPPLRSSLENVRVNKALDVSKKPINAVSKKLSAKPKVQSRSIPKVALKPNSSSRSKLDSVKVGSTSSLPTACKGSQIKSPDNYRKNFMAAGDSKQIPIKRDWEMLCREERHKNALLKQQLETEAKMYKSQIENMRTSFEGELFALKKQNIILKARVDELSLSERRVEIPVKNDMKITLLEQELEKQESLIHAYETENKKLMQDTKRMQEELKNLQSKQKSTISKTNDMQQLTDRVKDLQEETLKLNLEVSELKEKNADFLLKNDDLIQQNSLLTDELDMFKEQLKAKSNFITDRLQVMTTTELEFKKQIEDLSIKLSSKSEQLRVTKRELEKFQQDISPLEKELLEFRVREGNMQEKLRISKSHVEREKQLTQRLKDQVILDNKKVMDLNRQVRELERILKRKNPDSVSALILTANSEQDKIGSEKVKLLEERIASLENEIKNKEDIAQQNLVDLQKKFSDMKEKYATQVMELEAKLLEATVKEHKLYNDMFTQTTVKYVENKNVENNKKDDKASTMEDKKDQKTIKAGPKSQNPKEDAYLIATIRGLKVEIANKDKTVSKITKEYQELQKTNRRLQKEREKLLNDRRSFRSMDFDKVFRGMKNGEGNDQNSNVYQNGHVSDTQRLSSSTPKLYDPVQYTENGKNGVIKKLTNENDILKEELSKINKDFMALKSKRLHDLNLLQEEHEREMATLVKEYSVKIGDSKAVKLQGQINTQGAIISHLKEQVEKFRDYKEQVIILKTEREHLENKVKSLTEKVKYLSTPGTEQLQLLQDKITILQQRHESREMTLQTLIRDLLRNRTQCKDCKNEKGKNRQLCYFRQELDHILGMLQEITNVH
ncbi:PREDICTED: centrosomal protein of 162 kDa [Cyphomyrmex costatus]|uniref:Centrosomal protein of 162 kDa n=1 Tax=Cyphomyrmex costatus TaxID=456900 RepID=A0A195CCN4_9HYME|nr:PREDICTED: centrosomal protein of 162 kDa [Cyphomyrmex costatus]KYM98619.1 Protein QN1 like protein [Cyphomyrmex costatus]